MSSGCDLSTTSPVFTISRAVILCTEVVIKDKEDEVLQRLIFWNPDRISQSRHVKDVGWLEERLDLVITKDCITYVDNLFQFNISLTSPLILSLELNLISIST